jgi:hypothetical protein
LGLVTMLTPEPYAPYRRPPLTNGYLRGEASREDLPIESDGWFEANGVELRLLTSVDAIDRQRQIVITDEGEELSYDVCVLATGSEPIRPPVPGGDDPEILTMRTVENSTRLQDRVGEGDRALSALAMQTNVPPEHYEVLLVLDRCTDGTGERAMEVAGAHPGLRLHLLEGPGLGSGHARRAGMEAVVKSLQRVPTPMARSASRACGWRPTCRWSQRPRGRVDDCRAWSPCRPASLRPGSRSVRRGASRHLWLRSRSCPRH